MEIFVIIGAILVVVGIIGSIIPAMPGPILSFLGLLMLFFAESRDEISVTMLVWFGISVLILTVLDYAAPILGAKFAGSSKDGVWGAVIGALVGIIFFPPLGIFLGALAGAILGEIYGGKETKNAVRAGIGVVLGSLTVVALQVVYSLVAAVYFFIKAF